MKIYSMLPFLAGACGNLFGGSVSDVAGATVRLEDGPPWSWRTTGLFVSAICLFGTAITPSKYWAVRF